MKHNNFTKYSQVEEFYMQNLVKIIDALPQNKTSIIWQEVLDNGVKVGENTIVNVWKGGFQQELDLVTRRGYRSILYACWYLDKISWGVDWPEYYKVGTFT
jgi:hexosaminidase